MPLEAARSLIATASAGAPVIFICYRREDTEEFTALVNFKLESHFGDRASVFWDHGDIDYGEDFPEKIREALKASRALVAIIGSRWLDIKDKETGRRRLDEEKDFVRVEIASALAAGVPVIPVVVKDATPPEAADLPEDLKPLAAKNALFLRSVRHFDRDVKDLIAALEKALAKRPKEHALFRTLKRVVNQEGIEQRQEAFLKSVGVIAAFFFLFLLVFLNMILSKC